LRSPTGIGEGARLAIAALSDLGYSVGLADFSKSLPSDILPSLEGVGISPAEAGGPLILHANPPILQQHLTRMRHNVGHRSIIGYWAWELPVVPRSWRRALDLVHEVWVPSRFVADAVAATGTDRPIHVVPHPVRRVSEAAKPIDLAAGRVVFLTMFSYGSGFERKNPLAAIRAFRRAFGDRMDVLLVVKSQSLFGTRPPMADRISEAVRGALNIQVMEENLSVGDRDALLARADVVISLHRSEGFGLTLAEAMLIGKPVVATNWSGNVDFMAPDASVPIRYDLVPVRDPGGPYAKIASVWAEPDVDHAAVELVRLMDPTHRRVVGEAARLSSEHYFSLSTFAALVAPALGAPAHARPPR
jgi:glycosyltransferase involved in cell wall biosynthesis